MFRFSLRWLLNFGGFVVPLPASLISTIPVCLVHRRRPHREHPADSSVLAGGEPIRRRGRRLDPHPALGVRGVHYRIHYAIFEKVQGMRSDGLVLWQLWRKRKITQRLMSFLALRAAEMKGVR